MINTPAEPIRIHSYTLTCALGAGLSAIRSSMQGNQPALTPCAFPGCDLPTWVGLAPGSEAHVMPEAFLDFDSRNNRLIDFALQQDGFDRSVQQLAAALSPERVAVIMGSSTASMASSEQATKNARTDITTLVPDNTSVHCPHAPGRYVAERLALSGPALTISTACSSSAKAFAMASRWLQAGLVDAVVVGGSDSLSLGTLFGFDALNLLSAKPCKPFDSHRDGISVGEAAGFALLSNARGRSVIENSGLSLCGVGESSDAHHMSHPHPQGDGAVAAMQQALYQAGCETNDVGYINLHGTATPTNDAIESQAVARLFSHSTLASSTKGWTGHTLGAAGITSAVLTLEALATGCVPGTFNLEQPDPSLAFPILGKNTQCDIAYALVNTFGFGGSNCTLMFNKASR